MRSVARPIAAALAAFGLSGCVAGQDLIDGTGLGNLFADQEPLYLSLTDADVRLANAALDRALERNPSGTASSWRNRTSGNSGRVTPLRSWQRSDGVYCREYEEAITVAGDSEAWTDTACRVRPAFWQPVD